MSWPAPLLFVEVIVLVVEIDQVRIELAVQLLDFVFRIRILIDFEVVDYVIFLFFVVEVEVIVLVEVLIDIGVDIHIVEVYSIFGLVSITNVIVLLLR
ncbi:MAG: hypothetical protein ABI877_11215 [Gemmatimonadaceae bacterium]